MNYGEKGLLYFYGFKVFWYFNEESQKPIRFSHLIEFSWKFIESVEFIPKLNTKQFGNENENNLSWGKTILRT